LESFTEEGSAFSFAVFVLCT